MTNLKRRQITEHLAVHNTKTYNLLKASEECQELALVLQQKVLKPTKVTEQQIIDEIGDVIIRLGVLKKLYPKNKIKERIFKKLNAYDTYIKTNRYRNI